MCARGVAESVVHVLLVCGRERTEMVRLAPSEMGWDGNGRIARTEREWRLGLIVGQQRRELYKPSRVCWKRCGSTCVKNREQDTGYCSFCYIFTDRKA